MARPARRAAASVLELARRTPETRRRDLDLLRAAAVGAVVLGHWILMTVERGPGGELVGHTALPALTWAHPLTWLFQVMPVFFLVGGAANAISWTRRRDRGGTAALWLLDRSARLLPPLTAFLVVVAAGTLAARWAGIAPEAVGRATALVTLPLWFLVVYLAVTALTPVTYRLHERYGLAVPALLVAGVAAGDLLRFTTGEELTGAGSFALGWLAVHQAGFAWRDGTLPRGPGQAAALLVGGVLGLVLLTGPGPYPVSMVTVPGAAMQNPSPPTLALLTLAAAQLGLAALLSGAVRSGLRRPRPWAVVVAVNTVTLTVYLWHLVAALLGAFALDALGLLPPADPRTAAWWLGRVGWVAALAVVLSVLVAAFGPLEARVTTRRARQGRDRTGDVPGTPRGAARLARTGPVAAGYAAVVVGVLWLTAFGQGLEGSHALPASGLALALAGAAVLRLGRRAAAR